MNYLVADIINSFGLGAIPVSTVIKPWYPKPSLFGMDQIYVINLQRRPER